MAHSENVRYQLAAKQLDDLFLQWIADPDANELVNSLIEEAPKPKPSKKLLECPPPIFKMSMPSSPHRVECPASPSIPGGGARTTPMTPPKNFPQVGNEFQSPKKSRESDQSEESKEALGTTLTTKELKEAMKSREKIPKFYFPEGKPLEDQIQKENDKLISDTFAIKPDGLQVADLIPITSKLFKFPKFLNQLLFERIK